MQKDVFSKVDYKDSGLKSKVQKEANDKFGQKNSYVKNLWILKEYKKRGGKVKYSGEKPSPDSIKKQTKGNIEVDLSETAFTLFFNESMEIINKSSDASIKELLEDLETFSYAYDDQDFMEDFIEEAVEKKKNVKLNKPFRTPSGPKKFSVYVKNDKGNVVKVNFGDPNMEIKRDDPERRKSFRARHGCDNPGPKTKAKYWSCRMWSSKKVSSIAELLQDSPEWSEGFEDCEQINEE